MRTAYLGLGSNKGERISYIKKALSEIGKIENTRIVKSSSIYETEPWGVEDQDDYLNSAVELETSLDPENLLKELKNIERKTGRTGNKKWSEREIDIDLLFYGDEIIDNEFMNVPHSQIENRKFVLIPMNEIAPEFIHPVLKKSITDLLKESKDELSVIEFKFIKSGK